MTDRSFFPPPGGRLGTNLRKERLAMPLMQLLVCLCVFFAASCVYASGMAPTADGSGSNMIYHLSSGINCTHTPVTVFGSYYKTPSDDHGYHLVVPFATDHVPSSFNALAIDFKDEDYFVSDQGVYSPWNNDSTYDVTYSGPSDGPSVTDFIGQSSGNIVSFGFSEDNTGVEPGRYPASITVTDLGSPTQSNVTDAPICFDFDIWVVDLAEQAGTISVAEGGIYEIDLTAIPADFPHEDSCDISVSWMDTPPPGMPSVSNLFYDTLGQRPVTEDTGSFCTKKWTYGDEDNTPERIYYKRPTGAYTSHTITLTLSVNNHQLAQKMLMFNTRAKGLLKYVDAPLTWGGESSAKLQGYWTHELEDYPDNEWLDDDEDGFNIDRIGYVVDDKNRPFVFSVGDAFHLEKAAFKAENNTDLSTFGYGVSTDKYNYSGVGLIGSKNIFTNEYTVDLDDDISYGDTLSVIDSQIVTATWFIGLDRIRSKHRVYTIGGTLTEYNDYHTLIDLSCEAAKGLSSTQHDLIVAREWDVLKSLTINRIDNYGSLKYWGSGTVACEWDHITLEDLLDTGDGDCNAWGIFAKELLSLQGITCNLKRIELRTYPGVYNNKQCLGFLQKQSTVQGGSIDLADSHVTFSNHVLLEYFDQSGLRKIYDIGTGRGPFSTWQEYAQSELEFCYGSYECINNELIKVIAFKRNVTDPDSWFQYIDF